MADRPLAYKPANVVNVSPIHSRQTFLDADGSLADEIDVNCERLWVVAERARARGSLSRDDIAFVRTLAVYPVLEAGAIRYFDCAPLSEQVRPIVRTRQWRFARPVNAAMVHWSLGGAE